MIRAKPDQGALVDEVLTPQAIGDSTAGRGDADAGVGPSWRFGGKTLRAAKALLRGVAIAQSREGLGGTEHTVERFHLPRQEERREIELSRLRLGHLADSRDVAEPEVGVADFDEPRP